MDSARGIGSALRSCGITLNCEQREQVSRYLALLRKWRPHYNLTAVEDGDELLRFHFIEACWAASVFLPPGRIVADIGSGAGFPGMVMKLYRLDLSVSLIERSYKKSVFLRELARHLPLEAEVFTGLAEDFPAWSRCDVATIRALKPSAELLRLLASNDVQLLVFHGIQAAALPDWEVVRRERFPLSRNRWVTLYAAAVET